MCEFSRLITALQGNRTYFKLTICPTLLYEKHNIMWHAHFASYRWHSKKLHIFHIPHHNLATSQDILCTCLSLLWWLSHIISVPRSKHNVLSTSCFVSTVLRPGMTCSELIHSHSCMTIIRQSTAMLVILWGFELNTNVSVLICYQWQCYYTAV